jgi:hypothetical protein
MSLCFILYSKLATAVFFAFSRCSHSCSARNMDFHKTTKCRYVDILSLYSQLWIRMNNVFILLLCSVSSIKATLCVGFFVFLQNVLFISWTFLLRCVGTRHFSSSEGPGFLTFRFISFQSIVLYSTFQSFIYFVPSIKMRQHRIWRQCVRYRPTESNRKTQ